MRERQPLVDPRPVGQAVRIELPRRQHHLLWAAVERMPIVVDRHEVVSVRISCNWPKVSSSGLVIPEPNVLLSVVALRVMSSRVSVASPVSARSSTWSTRRRAALHRCCAE